MPSDGVSPFERRKDCYPLSVGRARLDIEAIHRFLAEQSYCARDLGRARLDRALA